jgi:hypothetical protein
LNNDTATRDATIKLLQFERWGLNFHSIGIFENQEEINRKVLARFSDVFEKQFSSLSASDRIAAYIKSLLKTGSFCHSYYLKAANRNWNCGCLYEAYASYWWKFEAFCPVLKQWISGTSAQESFAFLTRLSKTFRLSIHENNSELARRCALTMLKWGGVLKGNRERIMGMGEDICTHFRYLQKQLDLYTVDLKYDHRISGLAALITIKRGC